MVTGLLLGCCLLGSSSILKCKQTTLDQPHRYFPYDGEQNVSISPTLVWLNQEGADFYLVWIENTNFAEICYGSHVTVPKDYLLEGNYYKWRIQAFSKEGINSEVSNPWTFRTQNLRRDLPEAPIPSSPYYDQIDVSVHTDFVWYGGNNASAYQVIIREANEERNLVWRSDLLQCSSIVAPYGVLEKNKRYAWSIVSVNEKGSSPESPPLFFYTEE